MRHTHKYQPEIFPTLVLMLYLLAYTKNRPMDFPTKYFIDFENRFDSLFSTIQIFCIFIRRSHFKWNSEWAFASIELDKIFYLEIVSQVEKWLLFWCTLDAPTALGICIEFLLPRHPHNRKIIDILAATWRKALLLFSHGLIEMVIFQLTFSVNLNEWLEIWVPLPPPNAIH